MSVARHVASKCARPARVAFVEGCLRAAALISALALMACEADAGRVQRSVIFVGLDGADWQLLDEYLERGLMPNLARLVGEGHGGVLETEQPPLSPLLWTTMMTGVSPLEHRILDFTRRNPASGAREPITSDERRAPAIWNMVEAAGGTVAVFGLWATYPAEPVAGLIVTDRLFAFERVEEPPPGAVHPAALDGRAREIVVATEREVGFEALQAYLPWLTEAEYRQRLLASNPFSDPVAGLRRLLIETRALHRLAREWLPRERPRLAVVYLQGTDIVGHLFAPYAPPRQPSVSAEDFERFRRVPEAYFHEIDAVLGEYRALAGDLGATLMLASDHGFAWHEGRPSSPTGFAAGMAGRWHREEGMYLLWGGGIEATPGHGARGGIRRVCSTLLALLGLPPGEGLAGPPLAGAAAPTGATVDYSAGWRPAAGSAGAAAPAQAAQALAELQALGYLSEAEANATASGPVRDTRTGSSYNNEALLLESEGRPEAALAAYERALGVEPRLASANFNLSRLLHARKLDPERADRLLLAALEAGLADGVEQVIARAQAHRRDGQPKRSRTLIEAALALQPQAPALRLHRGRALLEQGDCQAAAADFEIAARASPTDPLPHASLGLARLCAGDPEGARVAFARSLELDPDQPELERFLAR